MVQGCTSDAGKSAVATGLCRAFRRRGLRVAPFKPQNMALNSAVTVDGGEIGRSQAAQAAACGLEPHSDMNPVLLKPTADRTAQVIVCGQVREDLDARGYQARKRALRAEMLAAHRRLAARYEIIVAEGAGSPAEVNLRADDIANMGFAEAVDCPVLLVADIDRGGVFATLVGTLELLSESERARVQGVIINRFRGDPSLLDPGLAWFTGYTGKPVLGVLPWLEGLYLEAEDSLARRDATAEADFRVVVPALPRMSNHTDLDALALTPGVAVSFVGPGQHPPAADLVVLPGSKHVRADLAWLRREGWPAYLQRHLRYGGTVIGLCGGYQMLGERIDDPDGVEGEAGSSEGLGLLEVTTRLRASKHLHRVRGQLVPETTALTGYEIHMGETDGPDTLRPVADLGSRPDGATSADGRVLGTYLHGLFDSPETRRALLARCGFEAFELPDQADLREAGIERLADTLEQHVDIDALLASSRQSQAPR
ncbi:cobyric acid synthase [Sediminicurvatus halobius]|uniref:Cobyric acid synthase n=1 Tax=Sediminicurvatus halobius TaxID=2182432 RepID=A0A2U2N1U9_9GAMM|nr:cobyric acid synthase [Spiribacter halobius]PWG63166.1 cobyric acid synthase CobQ [Spiribacter halobius]UEX79926.1 cobyric acid synthase [Spiribacter halobius]